MPTIKHYPLSTALIVFIWVLCLTPIVPDTPLGDVPLMDKWTHFLMYGTLCAVIWWEYLRRHSTLHTPPSTRQLLLWAFLAPLLMGGLVELAQAYCTGGHRSGEWADVLANGIGVCIGNLMGGLWLWVKGRKA